MGTALYSIYPLCWHTWLTLHPEQHCEPEPREKLGMHGGGGGFGLRHRPPLQRLEQQSLEETQSEFRPKGGRYVGGGGSASSHSLSHRYACTTCRHNSWAGEAAAGCCCCKYHCCTGCCSSPTRRRKERQSMHTAKVDCLHYSSRFRCHSFHCSSRRRKRRGHLPMRTPLL